MSTNPTLPPPQVTLVVSSQQQAIIYRLCSHCHTLQTKWATTYPDVVCEDCGTVAGGA